MTNDKIKLVKISRLNLKKLHNLMGDKNVMGNFQHTYKKKYKKFLKDYLNRKYFLVKNSNNEIIGFMYYKLENRFNAFEIGGAIIPEKRNNGYGYAAHRELINLLNKNTRRRIQAITCTNNIKEIKILKKCGLKIEGRLKKAGQIGNKLYDLMILGIFKENKRG